MPFFHLHFPLLHSLQPVSLQLLFDLLLFLLFLLQDASLSLASKFLLLSLLLQRLDLTDLAFPFHIPLHLGLLLDLQVLLPGQLSDPLLHSFLGQDPLLLQSIFIFDFELLLLMLLIFAPLCLNLLLTFSAFFENCKPFVKTFIY